jgi:PAS domain S-box-containing protein
MLEEKEKNIKNSSFGNISVDLKTKKAKWSAEIYNILGYDAEKVKPTLQKYIASIHSDEKDRVVDRMEEAIKTGVQYNLEHRIQKSMGDTVYVSVIGIVKEIDKEGSGELLLIIQDITNQKKKEHEIRESHYRNSFLLNNITDSVWRASFDFKYTYISPQIPALRGFTADEVVAFAPKENIHPDSLASATRILSEKLEEIAYGNLDGWKPFTIDIRERTKDNEYIWTRNSVRVIPSKNGEPSEIVGVSRDINTRKQQEKELIKYKKAIESNNEAIIVANVDGEITFINKAFEQLFEYSSNSLVGENISKVYTNERILNQIIGFLTKGESWEGELELNSKSGRVLLIYIQASSITNENNDIIGLFVSHKDIREKRESERRKENELVRQRITLQIAQLGTWYIDIKKDAEKIFLNKDLTKLQGEVFPSGVNYLHFKDEWVPSLLNADSDNGAKVVQLIYARLADPKVFDWFAEYQYIRPVDNKKIWLRTKAAIRRNRQGLPIYIYGATQDITRQKNNELQILSSQRLLEAQIHINEFEIKSDADFLDYTLNEVIALTNSEIGFFFYYDEYKKEFTLISWSKEAMEECKVLEPQTKSQLEDTGLWGEVVRQRRAIIVNEYNLEHPQAKGTPEGHIKLRRFMGIPIISDNKIVAVVGVANKSSDYNHTDEQQLSLVLDTVWKKLEKYHADQELKSSREKVQRILETVPVAVTIVDSKLSRFLLANEAASTLFAANKCEINDYDTSSIWLNSEDLDEFIIGIAGSNKYSAEKKIRRLGNNEQFWAAISAVPFEYEGSSAILITIVDMTEQKKLQFQLQETQRAADSIIDTMPIPTVVTNLKTGAILRANTAMAEFHGIEIDEFKNIRAHDWYLSPERREAIVGKLANKDFVVEEPTEMYRYKSKEIRNVLLSFVKLHYNNVDAIIGSVIDITKIQEAQEELEKAKELAEKANSAKSAFLANMSHEIRTPMNAIIGYTEILNNLVKDKEQKMYLESMFTSSKALLSLINDILDLSKIESGKMQLNYEVVNSKYFISELQIMFKERANKKGLDLICEKADDFPEVIVMDELRMRQVAINLIGNAIKFTKEGSVKLRLKANDIKDGHFNFIMEVADTGIGIKKEKIAEIFDDFIQEDGTTTRNYGGTGLGLSISKRIANLLNGELKVESEVGKGSVFMLDIPKVEYTNEDFHVEEFNNYNFNEIKFEKVDALVVDDIDTNRMMLKNHLDRLGINVHLAENGLQGLKIASEKLPEIIFMDIRMPIMDGYTALAKLKENPKTADIPVIACTASTLTVSEGKMKEMGFAGYIKKPLLLNELVKELCAILNWEKIDCEKEQSIEEEKLADKEILELKQQVQKIWAELEAKRTTKLSKQFADLLISNGEQMKNSWISNKGVELKEAIASFNVESTKKIITEFKELFNSTEK